jgi:integrase
MEGLLMGKRGNGEGSVRQRPDGTWEARVSLPDGRRKSLYAKTRQEAARKLAAAHRDRDQGLPVLTGDRLTLGTLFDDWLEMKKVTCSYRTWLG